MSHPSKAEKKSNRKSITLDEPIISDGVSISSLSMRAPKVKDMLSVEKTDKSDAEKEIYILANLCEISPAAIEELDLSDYTKLQKAYQSFLS